jgi:hypothetical protein
MCENSVEGRSEPIEAAGQVRGDPSEIVLARSSRLVQIADEDRDRARGRRRPIPVEPAQMVTNPDGFEENRCRRRRFLLFC